MTAAKTKVQRKKAKVQCGRQNKIKKVIRKAANFFHWRPCGKCFIMANDK